MSIAYKIQFAIHNTNFNFIDGHDIVYKPCVYQEYVTS